MVADLLELHELGQDDPSALHAVGILELLFQIAYGLLIEGGLLAAQRAKGRHLDLFGQVGDHSLVGLEPAQNVRSDEGPEWLVRRTGLHLLDQTGERLGTAQEAGVQKIEQRPEIGQAILDRSARHGDAGRRFQLLDGPRLPRARVLDRLGFVEDDEVPVASVAAIRCAITCRRS